MSDSCTVAIICINPLVFVGLRDRVVDGHSSASRSSAGTAALPKPPLCSRDKQAISGRDGRQREKEEEEEDAARTPSRRW